jgi:hypothetical protein
MRRIIWTRWLRSMFGAQAKTRQARRRRSPLLEHLETRLAPAQTFIWSGSGGINNAWSNGANWQGGVAPTGSAVDLDSLSFPIGAGNTNTVNDLSAAAFSSITIQGSGYTLGGNPLTLGDPSSGGNSLIVNSGASGVNLTLDVELTGPASAKQFFEVGSGADLTITGSGDDIKVGDQASVICGGVQTANATVYLIDTVLMPPAA